MPRKEMLKIYFPLYSLFGGAAYDFSTIKNGELFLSYPNNFNDPFDGAIIIDQSEFVKEFLKRRLDDNIVSAVFSEIVKDDSADAFDLIAKHDFMRKTFSYCKNLYSDKCEILLDIDVDKLKEECFNLYNEYIESIKKIRNEYGVACFTTNAPQNNMVMWAHYANNYRGFCCKFEFDYYDVDTPRDTKGTANILKHFYKVVYTKKFPFIDVKRLFNYPPNESHKNKYIYRFIERTLTLKHTQWKYENEYRIIIHKDSRLFEKTFSRNKCGFKIPFSYLNALYISFEKCIDETSIRDIATKHKIKYYGLMPSKSGVELVEDDSIMNIHNIILDSNRILNSFSKQELPEKEMLPF